MKDVFYTQLFLYFYISIFLWLSYFTQSHRDFSGIKFLIINRLDNLRFLLNRYVTRDNIKRTDDEFQILAEHFGRALGREIQT